MGPDLCAGQSSPVRWLFRREVAQTGLKPPHRTATSALSSCISLLLPIFLSRQRLLHTPVLLRCFLSAQRVGPSLFIFWYPVAGGLCRRLRALMDYVATVSLKYKRAPDSHQGAEGPCSA